MSHHLVQDHSECQCQGGPIGELNMARAIWSRLDKVVRDIHLYSGLLLAPWMLMYATSAFFLIHGNWLQTERPGWEPIREVQLALDMEFPGERAEQARAILRHLDLDGAHRVQGKPNPKQLLVIRFSGTGNQRVTWRKAENLLVVEKQEPFAFRRLMHFLHFRAGYHQPYWQYVLWGATVDLAVFSMWLWVISGIYLWARVPRKRKWGAVAVVGGGLLFAILVIALCDA
jgi:hypothetical protein